MSHLAFLRTPRGIAAVAVLLLALGGTLWWGLSGDDDADPLSAGPDPETSATPTPEPSSTTSATPKPTKTPSAATPTCEGPDTKFNLEGTEQESLLPDCGEAPVAADARQPLGLGCGGTYPVILYKTDTGGSKSSICGVDSSGARVRVVVAPGGGEPLDLKGRYDYRTDSFVAKDGDTTYQVVAYNGSIVTRAGSGSSTETSDNWSSLDNESDYD